MTFKNLEVLDKWIKLSENKYLGAIKRTLWLSENGAHSPSYSEKDLKEQAAALAYTWKKLQHLDGIDAMQWHNWIDNRMEFGLLIGLLHFIDDETDPEGRKPVIGINDWSEVVQEINSEFLTCSLNIIKIQRDN